MTIETPNPYGWTIEGTPIIWRGENAIAEAKAYARRWKEEPEPIPLYKEPPVTEESSAAQQGLTDEEIEAIINDIWGNKQGKRAILNQLCKLKNEH